MLRHALIAKIAAGVIGTVVLAGGGIALASTTFETDEPSTTIENEQPDDNGQQGQDGTVCDDDSQNGHANQANAEEHGEDADRQGEDVDRQGEDADEHGEDADEQGEDCDGDEGHGDADDAEGDNGDDNSSPVATPTQD